MPDTEGTLWRGAFISWRKNPWDLITFHCTPYCKGFIPSQHHNRGEEPSVWNFGGRTQSVTKPQYSSTSPQSSHPSHNARYSHSMPSSPEILACSSMSEKSTSGVSCETVGRPCPRWAWEIRCHWFQGSLLAQPRGEETQIFAQSQGHSAPLLLNII